MSAEACTLAEALYQRCLDLGTTFVFNTSVEQITTDAAGVTGVRIQDGSTVAADVVVADADARTVYGTLLQDRRTRGPLQRLAKMQPSFSGFVLLLAVDGQTPGIRHHNVWFPADYDAEFDQLFSKNPSPVSDPAIYACVPDDPAMRPDGAESWFILVNAPTQDPPAMDWSARSEDYADHVLAVLAERGVDLRGRIRWRRIRTPENLATGTASPVAASTECPATAGCPPHCARPTAAPFPVCSSSAGRHTPAAACHWSAWARRSWPPKSAGLEPAVPRSPTVE